MSHQTPTKGGDGQSQSREVQNGHTHPSIVSSTIERSGGFNGTPDAISATVAYIIEKNGGVEMQTTVVFSVDDNHIARVEDTSGDGTVAEQFIPISYAASQLTHLNSVRGVDGVPGANTVANQLTGVPSIPGGSGQSGAGAGGSMGQSPGTNSTPPNQNHHPEGQQTQTDSGGEETFDPTLPGDREPPAGVQDPTQNGEQHRSDGAGQHPSSTPPEQTPQPQDTQQQDQSDSGMEEFVSETGMGGHDLISSEDSVWAVDDESSGRDEIVASIVNQETGDSIAVWDLTQDEATADFGVIYYSEDDTEEDEADNYQQAIEVVENWKQNPPEIAR